MLLELLRMSPIGPVGKEAKLEVDVAYSLRSRTPRRLLLHELGKQ